MQERLISRNEFEQCTKCTSCTVVCPVLAANPSYPGPKQAGPDGERYRLKNPHFYDEALKMCMNCKRCEVACPSGVRIGDIIQSAKITHGKRSHILRDTMLASTDLMGPVATTFAPIVNTALRLSPVKSLLDTTIGIDKHRILPKYSSRTFESWYNKNAAGLQTTYKNQISYFHGCYANYNYPQLGKDFVALMNALGYGVQLLDERCCGVAKISAGMAESARKDAIRNIDAFRQSLAKGLPIVTVSTSCTLTIREEYPHLLGVENADVKDNITLVERFVYNLVTSGKVKLVFKEGYKARTAYHSPCHQERLGWSIYTIGLLKMIPGLEMTVLESNCCGMAGTYGFKKENYDTSQKIGKPLFENIAEVAPDFVACECETCKWQIEMSTPYCVKNPVTILAEALDLEATEKANSTYCTL